MACLYCGKEIGPFRLLRDTEFCSSEHRKGYSTRLGKALELISDHEPPPAQVAGFIPQKPLHGNNLSPSPLLQFEPSEAVILFPRIWPVGLPSTLRQDPLALRRPEPSHSPPPESCTGSRARSDPYDVALRLPRLPDPISPLPEFDQLIERDPAPAGPVSAPPRPAEIAGGPHGRLVPSRSQQLAAPPPLAVPLSISLCRSARGPRPDPVESWLPALPGPAVIPQNSATLLPLLTLSAEDWTVAADIADAVGRPAAEPAERFLIPCAVAQAVAYPTGAILPRLPMQASEWQLGAELAGAATSPGAEPVEILLRTPDYPAPAPYMATQPALRSAMPAPIDWTIEVASADFLAGPAAQRVEAWLPQPVEPRAVPFAPPAQTALPSAVPSPIDWTIEVASADFLTGPAAQPVEAWLPQSVEPRAVPFARAAPTIRACDLAVAEPDVWQETAIIAPPAGCLPGPQPAELEREVTPSIATAQLIAAALQAPAFAELAPDPAEIRWAGGWQLPSNAEPVFSYVTARLAEPIAPAPALALPGLGSLQSIARTAGARRAGFLASAVNEELPQAKPPVESPAAVVAGETGEGGERNPRVVQFPALRLEQSGGTRPAGFQAPEPLAAGPREAAPSSQPAIPRDIPDAAALVNGPAAYMSHGVPQKGPAGMEFFCQRMPGTPVRNLVWQTRLYEVRAPKFVVRPIFERTAEVAQLKPDRKTAAFAEIFTITDAARKRASGHSGLRSLGKLIAASLLVGIGLWVGAGSVKLGRRLVSINTSLPGSSEEKNARSGAYDTSASSAGGRPSSPGFSGRSAPHGPIAAVRQAIEKRAAVELTDTFRRTEAWGAAAKALPAGWSRHPDGYVRTGQLALYRPTQTFADYHFEFFGGIEKKSIGWAIRARDPQNYYAMKFTVVEPGLRPMIAVVHYAVVGGRKGQKVETPLSVMFHNNEAYHVSVDVQGNQVTTSIEGQEVDRFTEDSLKTGGVGFFSELGESARLYWIRVTKNQDWLGRVCAYLSGGSATDSAELWRGDFSNQPQAPTQPALPPNADTSLAAAETDAFSWMGPQRGRILKYGRTELCRS